MTLNESQIRKIVTNAVANIINEAEGDKLEMIKNVFRRKYQNLGWSPERIEAQIAKDFPEKGEKKAKPQPSSRSNAASYDATQCNKFFDFDNLDYDPVSVNGQLYNMVYERVNRIVGRVLNEHLSR